MITVDIYSFNQELIQHFFNYKDGELYWKISPKAGVNKGDQAGYVEPRGYKVIKVLSKKYKAHKLIFLYHRGYMPKFIDHINNNRVDNRIENLREATRIQNNQNANIRKDNTSGIKGVFYDKRNKKWIACLHYNKQRIIKRFDYFEEAKKEIRKMREIYHKEFCNHGYV